MLIDIIYMHVLAHVLCIAYMYVHGSLLLILWHMYICIAYIYTTLSLNPSLSSSYWEWNFSKSRLVCRSVGWLVCLKLLKGREDSLPMLLSLLAIVSFYLYFFFLSHSIYCLIYLYQIIILPVQYSIPEGTD